MQSILTGMITVVMRKGEPMNDLISRQAAIRWVKTECNPYGKPTLDFESGKKVIEHLEQMPSAEPERKKGNEKCSNELPCGWCSLFDTPCFGRGGEQDE
jgi:hypothetical protein